MELLYVITKRELLFKCYYAMFYIVLSVSVCNHSLSNFLQDQ